MKRINDIFYSLQGEGHNSGMPAVFIRFAGCNLRCPFCDTDFSSYTEMTDRQIVSQAASYPARLAVLTGGEPTLQADEALIDMLHEAGFTVAMESNGTNPPPRGTDWLTCSPKSGVRISHCDELKCIFDGDPQHVSDHGITASYYYLQPCDVGDPQHNADITAACVAYIKEHPKWRLSLQTHKLAGFK